MKKNLLISSLALLLSLTATIAGAADLTGKFGVTGRIGFLVPSDSEISNIASYPFNNLQTVSTDVGFIGGGGFLYGINKNFAAELDITNSNFSGNADNFSTYSNSLDFNIINLSLGGQYRFKELSGITPYVGAGLDILINSVDNGYNVDTTVGGHISGGIDYFVMKNLALTTELKLVLAPDTDIMGTTILNPGKQGNFNPSSFSMTFGVRYFIN